MTEPVSHGSSKLEVYTPISTPVASPRSTRPAHQIIRPRVESSPSAPPPKVISPRTVSAQPVLSQQNELNLTKKQKESEEGSEESAAVQGNSNDLKMKTANATSPQGINPDSNLYVIEKDEISPKEKNIEAVTAIETETKTEDSAPSAEEAYSYDEDMFDDPLQSPHPTSSAHDAVLKEAQKLLQVAPDEQEHLLEQQQCAIIDARAQRIVNQSIHRSVLADDVKAYMERNGIGTNSTFHGKLDDHAEATEELLLMEVLCWPE